MVYHFSASNAGETRVEAAEKLTALNRRVTDDSDIRYSLATGRGSVNRTLSRRSSHNSKKVPFYRAEGLSVALLFIL